MHDFFNKLNVNQKATLIYCTAQILKLSGQEILAYCSNMQTSMEDMGIPIILTNLTADNVKSNIRSIPSQYKNDLIHYFTVDLCQGRSRVITQEKFNLIAAILSNANIPHWDILSYAIKQKITLQP